MYDGSYYEYLGNDKETNLHTGLHWMNLGSDMSESASSMGAGSCLFSQVKSGCWSEPLTQICQKMELVNVDLFRI